MTLYRVAQEALTNVRKHACAKGADILVGEHDSGFVVRIADDGVGFEPERTDLPGILGLAAMRERIELAGGTIRIDSAPGTGTMSNAGFRPASAVWTEQPDGKGLMTYREADPRSRCGRLSSHADRVGVAVRVHRRARAGRLCGRRGQGNRDRCPRATGRSARRPAEACRRRPRRGARHRRMLAAHEDHRAHSVAGEGGVGPPFTDRILKGLSTSEIVAVVGASRPSQLCPGHDR